MGRDDVGCLAFKPSLIELELGAGEGLHLISGGIGAANVPCEGGLWLPLAVLLSGTRKGTGTTVLVGIGV